jgi:hypothetical protein
MPNASPPKGTTKTARPSTNQRSTPPKGDVSYFFAWASLYFLASSTQHSRPSFFVARCAVSTATPRLDGIATGRARTGTGSRGLARAAREARAWTRPRGGAAARTDTAMASIARVRCVEDTRRDDDELADGTETRRRLARKPGSRRGGQLALFDITPDSRNRLTERALRRAMSHRAACT